MISFDNRLPRIQRKLPQALNAPSQVFDEVTFFLLLHITYGFELRNAHAIAFDSTQRIRNVKHTKTSVHGDVTRTIEPKQNAENNKNTSSSRRRTPSISPRTFSTKWRKLVTTLVTRRHVRERRAAIGRSGEDGS
ncbi:hypothetical protein Zmor_027694 [Zophobas morio]|uniref:Uncharacterized protein n=1 Tax=Zophobas morio TaxID=2755281 RepID=A0AA38HPR7_9CUCU|nr:hypothetical protein Zmor_027694 [Zophobas morio]